MSSGNIVQIIGAVVDVEFPVERCPRSTMRCVSMKMG